VAEVSRPDRAAQRRQGKSDPLDAYAAARTALARDGVAVPKDEYTKGCRCGSRALRLVHSRKVRLRTTLGPHVVRDGDDLRVSERLKQLPRAGCRR
jgi:hypothetical protein